MENDIYVYIGDTIEKIMEPKIWWCIFIHEKHEDPMVIKDKAPFIYSSYEKLLAAINSKSIEEDIKGWQKEGKFVSIRPIKLINLR